MFSFQFTKLLHNPSVDVLLKEKRLFSLDVVLPAGSITLQIVYCTPGVQIIYHHFCETSDLKNKTCLHLIIDKY